MTMRRVNRNALDGTSIVLMFGRLYIPCLKASYGDKIEPENLTFMGSQQIDAQTTGIYSTDDAKVTMESTVFRAELLPQFQQNGFGNERLSIIFSYSHPDLGDDSDFIDGARFTNIAAAVENSAKAFEVELTIKFTQCYWGDDRKTINALDPAQALAASNF